MYELIKYVGRLAFPMHGLVFVEKVRQLCFVRRIVLLTLGIGMPGEIVCIVAGLSHVIELSRAVSRS